MKHSIYTIKKRGISAFICLIFLLLLFFGSSCNLNPEETQAKFDTFTQELFCKEIAENTINLHFTVAHPEEMGITDYEVTYGDFSRESLAQSVARSENYLSVLESISPSALTLNQQVTYDVLMDQLDPSYDASKFYLYDEVLSSSSGLQAQLPILLEEYTFYDEQDVKDYLTLLGQTKAYFEQVVAFEKEKSEAGLFMPDYSCQSVIDQCNEFVTAGEEHFLIETFNKRVTQLDGLSSEARDAYIAQNESLVKNDLVEAYQYLGNEMTALLGSGTNEMGLCYFPDGTEYYEALVYSSTGSSKSIPEIKELISDARTDALVRCSVLIQEDETLWEKCVNTTLPAKDASATLTELQQDMLGAFPIPPETNYRVNYIDESIADFVAPAYYIVAPIDEYDNHSIHINAETNTSDITYFTTLAHEGFPGHLYQTVMSYEAGLPAVRNLASYNGYVEGWATYVEMISYYYADVDFEVAAFLQNNQSAMISLYATTDIGIHYDGWGLTETLDFWSSYGIDDAEVIQEIYEYIVSEPANYLQYYVGYLEFLELREEIEAKQKEDFCEVSFHQAILAIGPAPFDIVSDYWDEYYTLFNSNN